MYRQSPRSRGQRSNKGFKVKHGLLLVLMLGVGIWLLYQTQRSYYHKGKSLGQGANVSERLRLGRKDLPEFGDAETRTRGNEEVVNAGGSEMRDEVGKKEKVNGGNYGFKSKVDDKKEEVKKVGDEGKKNEGDEKTPSGEMKGVEKDGRIKNLSSSNDQVQDGSDNNEKVMAKKQDKDKDKDKEKEEGVFDAAKSTTAFSDETFVAHSQNETDDNPGFKIVKGERGADSYQPDSNTDPMLKAGDPNSVEGGYSTAFSDTNGNEEANGDENPRSSTSGTNEKDELEQPGNGNEEANGVENPRPSTSGNNEKTKSEQPDTSVQKEKSSNTDDNVKKQQHEQVESSNKVPERQNKEDANVNEHHEEADSSASQEVNYQTHLDTLSDSANQTHTKDAAAI